VTLKEASRHYFGNVWDNAAMENFFSSLKIERVKRYVY
jgi:transposase InsO family protein